MTTVDLQECLAYAWSVAVEGLHFETCGLTGRATECYANSTIIKDLVYECNRRYPPAIPDSPFIAALRGEVDAQLRSIQQHCSVDLFPPLNFHYACSGFFRRLYLRIRHWRYFRDGKKAGEAIWSFFRSAYTHHLLMKSWDQIMVRTLYDEYGNIIVLMSDREGEA